MYNRAEALHKQFFARLKSGELPPARSHTTPDEAGLTREQFLDLFETQMMSRLLDLRARILKNENECFYTIGSSGHESNAVWGHTFRITDMAFVHYRSCAFMIQRAKRLTGSTPLYDTLLSYVASSEDPIAGGRHKVFGSYPLMVPPQTSTIASHLPKAVGAAYSIARAREIDNEHRVMPADAVVLTSFGDASANHSTAVGGLNACLWYAHQGIEMPIIFICEDNGIGISVKTPNSWIESQYSLRSGLSYITCDGLNLADTIRASEQAEHIARHQRTPVFLHMKTVRLLGHAGSDVETSYHSLEEIEATEFQDPLLHSARTAIENSFLSAQDITDWYSSLDSQIAAIGEYVKTRPKYLTREEVRQSLTAVAHPKPEPATLTEEEMRSVVGAGDIHKPLHLAKLISMGLAETLARYPSATVFGEDVALKGGVYNVTDGLFKKFGDKRVFNTLLDEQSILGMAIGQAHNGFLPIPEIQFLAYIHNAEDQLRGEAATLSFFSQGQFTNGMVVRIAGLPYQKGFGGHFHNDNSLAVFRDIPGVIVAVPSNGEDAVKMLRTCAREAWCNGRVVVFVEPIALYMTKDLQSPNDKKWSFNYPITGTIELGEFGVWGKSKDLAIVTYGNGYYLSRQAAEILAEKHGIEPMIIDLRWLAPINTHGLIKQLEDVKSVLIVDECRKTGSWSEWMAGAMLENLSNMPKVKIIAADDCFIPLGKAAAAGLPSREEILNGALMLMNRV